MPDTVLVPDTVSVADALLVADALFAPDELDPDADDAPLRLELASLEPDAIVVLVLRLPVGFDPCDTVVSLVDPGLLLSGCV